jgi:hypothetical protein
MSARGGILCVRAALVAAAWCTGSIPVEASGSDWLEFTASHQFTITADMLQSATPPLAAHDAQLSVWSAADLRLQCTARRCMNTTLVARPWVGTFMGPAREYRGQRFRDIYEKVTLRAQEAHATISPLARLSITTGRLVTGWGPGILYSPTNRLVPETLFSAEQRQVQGRRLAVAAVRAGPGVVVSAMAGRADQEAWNTSRTRRHGLFVARAEYQGTGRRAVTFGVTGGAGQRHSAYGGAYGQLLVGDNLTIGFEGSVSRGYAGEIPGQPDAARPLTGDLAMNVRYGLSSGGEVAVEAVFNGFGHGGVRARTSSAVLSAAAAGGMTHPLADRRYITLYGRLPKLWPGDRVTAVASVTAAQPSGGSLWYGEVAYARDRYRVFVSGSASVGPDQSTLRVPFHRTTRVGITILQ